jgi:hypothetical protein
MNIPLSQRVDPRPALLIEVCCIDDPGCNVGVRAVVGIGGSGGSGWSSAAGGRGQLDTESGGLLEQAASVSRQASAASSSGFDVISESPVGSFKVS